MHSRLTKHANGLSSSVNASKANSNYHSGQKTNTGAEMYISQDEKDVFKILSTRYGIDYFRHYTDLRSTE